jgi:hypothetical protein
VSCLKRRRGQRDFPCHVKPKLAHPMENVNAV